MYALSCCVHVLPTFGVKSLAGVCVFCVCAVEFLNSGQVGEGGEDRSLVHCREVVPLSEVLCIKPEPVNWGGAICLVL